MWAVLIAPAIYVRAARRVLRTMHIKAQGLWALEYDSWV